MALGFPVYVAIYIDDSHYDTVDIQDYFGSQYEPFYPEEICEEYFSNYIYGKIYDYCQYTDVNGNEIGDAEGEDIASMRHTRGALINVYYVTPEPEEPNYYTLTVYHRGVGESGSGISLKTETFELEEGTIYSMSRYQESFNGYRAQGSSPSGINYIYGNTTLTITYVQQCELILHHVNKDNNQLEQIQSLGFFDYGSVQNPSTNKKSQGDFLTSTSTTSKEYDDIEYIEVRSSKDNSIILNSTKVYADFYNVKYENNYYVQSYVYFQSDSKDTSATDSYVRITQNPINVYFGYACKCETSTEKSNLVIEKNLPSVEVDEVDNFIGYSLTKGDSSELGAISGFIERPNGGWYSLTPSYSSSYLNPTIIYANVRVLAFSYVDKAGNTYTGNRIIFTSKDGVETIIEQLN